MSRKHFKSLVSFSSPSINVDKDKGTIKNIVIIQQGENKNGTYFNTDFLNDLMLKGNEQKQGVKCRFGHPNMCATSLGTFLGRYSNFRINENKVFGDLKLDPIAKKTKVEGKGISMWEYVLDMADSNPDMFGNSIVITGEKFDETIGGKEFLSHKLHSFIASDLVDEPAATESLFHNTNDLGIIVTDFLDNNPSIFSVIQKDQSIIEDFFSRYIDYTIKYKTNINMGFLDKLKKEFRNESAFDIEETTATGDIVKVVTDGEQPKVGDKVTDEDGKEIEDGDLLIKDGSTWVISEGAISEIKEKEEEEESKEEPTVSEVMQSVKGLTNAFNTFKSSYEKDLKENHEAIELIANEVGKFSTRFNTLAKSVKSASFETPNAEPTGVKTREDKDFEKFKNRNKKTK